MPDNRLIPNTFQTPNLYVDWVLYYLTPEETKVLLMAVREILGWYNKVEDRAGRIAYSVFAEGKVSTSTGETLCLGTGLNKNTVQRAVRALVKFGILLRGDTTNEGTMYTVQIDENQLNWEALESRRDRKEAANTARTRQARRARGVVAQEGVVGQVPQGGCETSAPGGLSDRNKETKETQEKGDHDLDLTWSAVLAELELTVGRGTFSSRYQHTALLSLNNTHAEVQCGDVEWFNVSGRAMVERQLSAVAGRDVSVVFV